MGNEILVSKRNARGETATVLQIPYIHLKFLVVRVCELISAPLIYSNDHKSIFTPNGFHDKPSQVHCIFVDASCSHK